MLTERELPGFRIRGQWRVRAVDLENWIQDRIDSESGQPISLQMEATHAETGLQSTTNTLSAEVILSEQHLNDLTERVSQEEMHRRFVDALGSPVVLNSAPLDTKPLEIDLAAPLPQRIRIYMYNATRPPGGRPLGEHKVQLIVPGQGRGDRGAFDHGDGRIVMLVGYAAEEDVFILWDAGLYTDFAWSRNVQVKGHTIIDATAGKIATQERRLRPSSGRSVVETVVAAKTRNLAAAIERRMELTRQRLLKD